MRMLTALLILLALAGGVVVGAALWESRHFVRPGPASEQIVLIVRPGSSLRTIAEDLANAGVIESPLLFRLGVIRRGRAAALKAGEYAFPARASEADVMDMLVQHRTLKHRITIAEGLTSDSVLAIVDANPVLVGAAVSIPEGSILPETYLFERGTTREEILARMRRAQADLLAELWPKRKPDLPFATVEEALILASIVEKETAIPAERPRVAAVFINRLKNGMRLEADPTIIYGLTRGAALGRPLRQSEIAAPNPYSTYQIDGLPPTPICNPGRESIAAVLNPADSDELFFVADGKGGHVFARTLAEHNRNVARLRRLEAQSRR